MDQQPRPAADELFTIVQEYKGGGKPVPCGDLVDFLLDQKNRAKDGVVLFDEMCWRMLGKGMPLMRANLSIGTLHPQIQGVGIRWWRERAVTEEFRVRHGIQHAKDYQESPIRQVIEQGITFRQHLGPDADIDRYPLLVSFRKSGATDYLACPLKMFVGRMSVVTWTTDHPGGFTEDHIAMIQSVLPALAVVVEAKALQRMNSNLLDIYLGRTIGRHILNGEVLRGQGQKLRAVMMAVDLRGFTALSDRLPGDALIALLNDYFEAVTAPVHARGGEILKFIGDGVLAMFEINPRSEQEAAEDGLNAGLEALGRLEALNELRRAAGRDLIHIGIGLHIGEMIYGNVGASDRLDFTAIGPSVNLVCRLESLTKRLERPLLVSEAFARTYGKPLVSLGFHPLRGLSEPQEAFAPR